MTTVKAPWTRPLWRRPGTVAAMAAQAPPVVREQLAGARQVAVAPAAPAAPRARSRAIPGRTRRVHGDLCRRPVPRRRRVQRSRAELPGHDLAVLGRHWGDAGTEPDRPGAGRRPGVLAGCVPVGPRSDAQGESGDQEARALRKGSGELDHTGCEVTEQRVGRTPVVHRSASHCQKWLPSRDATAKRG